VGLHVWKLTGPANTWEPQLQEHLAAEPVFAVLSGIGGKTWAPVHRFCEQAELPCLFPNVELPVVAESDFHSLYFSRGVLLEAGLIAHQLQEQPHWSTVRRLVQVYRADDIGAAAATMLAGESHRSGLEIVRAYSGRARRVRVFHPPSKTLAPEMTWCFGYGPKIWLRSAIIRSKRTACGCPA